MFCPKCGSEAKDGSGFCGNCGASLTQRDAGVATTPMTAAAAAAPVPAKLKIKNKLLLLIPIVVVVALIAGGIAWCQGMDPIYRPGTVERYDKSGNLIYRYEYNYDDQGRLSSYTILTHSQDKEVTTEYTKEWNKNICTTTAVPQNGETSVTEEELIESNDGKSIQLSPVQTKNEGVDIFSEWTLGDKGALTRYFQKMEYHTSSKSTSSSSYEYYFDAQGFITSYVSVADGSRSTYNYQYTTDSSGRPILCADANNNHVAYYHYDDQGYLAEVVNGDGSRVVLSDYVRIGHPSTYARAQATTAQAGNMRPQ